MNKLFLYYFFISAFLALILVAAYGLLLAGSKYNNEELNPQAIYERARYGVPSPTPIQRTIDSEQIQKSEMELNYEKSRQSEQNTSLETDLPSPTPDPSYIGSDGLPYQQ